MSADLATSLLAHAAALDAEYGYGPLVGNDLRAAADALDRAEAKRDAARALLLHLEIVSIGGVTCCPNCGALPHRDGCALWEMLHGEGK